MGLVGRDPVEFKAHPVHHFAETGIAQRSPPTPSLFSSTLHASSQPNVKTKVEKKTPLHQRALAHWLSIGAINLSMLSQAPRLNRHLPNYNPHFCGDLGDNYNCVHRYHSLREERAPKMLCFVPPFWTSEGMRDEAHAEDLKQSSPPNR